MKKNKITKTSAVLLAIALITAWGANGIYAKYVTEGTQEDSGRVAKWGVTLEANEGSGFAKSYAKEDANYTVGENSVVSSASDEVLAPGTSGSLKGIKVGGSPEVAVKISNAGTVTLTGWTANSSYYCPLKVTVDKTTLYGLDYESADAFKAAIEAEIAKCTAYKAPGTDLSKETGLFPAVSWAWEFEGANGSKVNRTDASDTALGDNATAPSINIKVKTTVTQVN